MEYGELILKTYNLADCLLLNSENMDRPTRKDILNGIVTSLCAKLSSDSNIKEISALKHLTDEGDFETLDVYYLTVSALLKFCASEVDLSLEYKELLEQQKETTNRVSEKYIHQKKLLEAYHKRYPGTSERFSGRGVVYSVITGNYDNINEPEIFEGFDYYLLTDYEPEDYNGKWCTKIVDNNHNLPANRLARYIKMHPAEFFPEYDYSVYLDGALKGVGNFRDFIDTYKKDSGIICFPHHVNTSIEEEARNIADNKRASKEELETQIKNYYDQGYIGKGYIVETGCLIRDHRDKALMKVMDDWWEELCSYDHNRDQMSFDYAFWKNRYDYDICDLVIYSNPWCEAAAVH